MINPQIFGKFILLERVSVGGMAEVYRAKMLDAPNFERYFAIKRILPNLAEDTEFVSMFINEAKVAVELEHPNVCQIYELGRLGQSHYIAMEYIAGRDVHAIQNYYRQQRKIMSISQACFIMAQAAQGLDYAHRAVDPNGKPLGLIHRDVSPQNLLVTYDGIVKLIDFGIAKASRSISHSKSGVVKGKFSYMSPEQATNGNIDHRSDIFALGVIFWELLTGRRLFQSESEFAIMEMISECNIKKPSHYNKMIPEAVERICMKALEKDPNNRYTWASEMVIDLFDFINGCKTPFTQWHLQNWMCEAFKKELQEEWDKLPIFNSINTAEDVAKYNAEHAASNPELNAAGDSISGSRNMGELETMDSAVINPGDSIDKPLLPPVPGRPIPKFDDISKPIPRSKPGEKPVPRSKPGEISKPMPRSLPGESSKPMPRSKPGEISKPMPRSKPGEISKPMPRSKPGEISKPMPLSNPGEISKPIPGVIPVSMPSAATDAKSDDDNNARLAVDSPASVDEEDIELTPEGIGPEVSDPQILAIKRAERKAKTRKGLVGFIVALCSVFILSPILLAIDIIKLPKPTPDLPDSAKLLLNVVPKSDKAHVSMFAFPKQDDSAEIFSGNGAVHEIDGLQAGAYLVEVATPGYETEQFSLNLENGTSDSRVELTHPLPVITNYRVRVTPENAHLYVNGKLEPGTGSERIIKGVVGTTNVIRAFRPGFESQTQSVTLDENTSLTFALLPDSPVTVSIHSDPARCSVYTVDETGKSTKRGETPLTLDNIDVDVPLNIEVKYGRQYWRRQIDFEQVDTSDIRIFADFNAPNS